MGVQNEFKVSPGPAEDQRRAIWITVRNVDQNAATDLKAEVEELVRDRIGDHGTVAAGLMATYKLDKFGLHP